MNKSMVFKITGIIPTIARTIAIKCVIALAGSLKRKTDDM